AVDLQRQLAIAPIEHQFQLSAQPPPRRGQERSDDAEEPAAYPGREPQDSDDRTEEPPEQPTEAPPEGAARPLANGAQVAGIRHGGLGQESNGGHPVSGPLDL